MLLRVPRTSLGVLTSSRGVVHGPLEVQLAEGGAWADCAEGRAIPGDCAAIECYAFYTRARCGLIRLELGGGLGGGGGQSFGSWRQRASCIPTSSEPSAEGLGREDIKR